jgi:hypothetical protein
MYVQSVLNIKKKIKETTSKINRKKTKQKRPLRIPCEIERIYLKGPKKMSIIKRINNKK